MGKLCSRLPRRVSFRLSVKPKLRSLSKTVLQPPASQGEFSPSHPCCKLLQSVHEATNLRKFTLELLEEFCLVRCKHVCTLMELNLKLSQDTGGLLLDASHYRQSIEKFISLTVPRSSIGFAVNLYMFASHTPHLLTASSVLHYFKTDPRFVSAYWISKQHDVVRRRSREDEYISMANVVCDLAARCDFIDHMIVARSGWFMSILEFFYCSLPRPPEVLCAFC